MRNMKKFANLLLALTLVLCMATTAFAAEGTLPDGSITISNPAAGQTYNAYQILYLESYSTDTHGNATGAYAYKVNTAWKDFFKDAEGEPSGAGLTYVDIDEQGYVTWKENASVADFAMAAQAYAKSKNLTPDGTETAPATIETNTVVKISDLKLGYYLVDTTLGTLCSLDTTNISMVVEEKNQAPTIDKQVQEDSNNTWGETNDADINQVVNFKTTITVQSGAENYTLHDTMSAGLSFINTGSVTVKVGDDDDDVDAANYTVTSTDLTDGCTFEVAFKNEYIASLAADTQIVVEYSATLNENAVVGLNGNTNSVKLAYGDEDKISYTPVDTTITYTWDAKVIKYTTQIVNGTESEVMLAGATFKLTTDEAGNNALNFHALAATDEAGNVTNANEYEHCASTTCSKDHVTVITTDATGTFYIEGLDAGTYYLHETAAPAGYNKLAEPVTVTITGATTDENNVAVYNTVETKVLNNAGSKLPSTGGMGTTVFYVLGGVLVLAAVVLLVTKKRMSATK